MRQMRFVIPGLVVLMTLTPAKKIKAQQSQPSRGWVGVVITTGVGQPTSAGTMLFQDYPVIESVDPGSPAERAGLMVGDILISLNSQDLRRNPIPMQSLLFPGNRVVFRYKRNDDTMSRTIEVAERPANTTGYVVLDWIGPAPSSGETRGPQTQVSIRARERGMRERSGGLPRSPMLPLIVDGSSTKFMGAELSQLNDGLREALRVKGAGVFVVNVITGTAAGEAGLKGGDVIVRVNQATIQTPIELIRFIRESADKSLLLQVMREQKTRTINLRW